MHEILRQLQVVAFKVFDQLVQIGTQRWMSELGIDTQALRSHWDKLSIWAKL